MSVQTWKDEFERYTLDEILQSGKPEMLQVYQYLHWRGYLSENLKKHNINLRTLMDEEYKSLPINSTYSHALCIVYRKRAEGSNLFDTPSASCVECPLAISRNGVSCLRPMEGEKEAPMFYWVDHDAQPMVDALRKMLQSNGFIK